MGQVGRRIGDRYRLVRKLGTGGMSVVWRGYDEVLGREVAVKVLSPEFAGDEAFRDRLRQEALSAARLCHPSITGIFDFRAICGRASASSWEGQATRTMSQPAAVSSAICCSVVLTSAVSVVVIDCTEIGDSLPTPTLPTLIWRVWRRGASTGGGAAGMPRLISVMA